MAKVIIEIKSGNRTFYFFLIFEKLFKNLFVAKFVFKYKQIVNFLFLKIFRFFHNFTFTKLIQIILENKFYQKKLTWELFKMFFRLGLLSLTLYLFGSPLGAAYGEIGQDKIQQVKKLIETQRNYTKYKFESNWEKIYHYQHPVYKKNISIEEFKYFDGQVTKNYRTSNRARISGGYAVPSLEMIKENQDKKDILGFPAVRQYYMTSNKFVKINEINLDKILMSDHRNYAKTIMTYKGIETFDPSLVRGTLRMPITLTMQDYWENVNGNWYITILENRTNLSGNVFYHFTPNDKSSWENATFVEFNSSNLDFDPVLIKKK